MKNPERMFRWNKVSVYKETFYGEKRLQGNTFTNKTVHKENYSHRKLFTKKIVHKESAHK